MKTCFKCHECLPLTEFYKHPRMADGHLNKCKECAKLDVLRARGKAEYISAYEKMRYQRPERKKAIAAANKIWAEKNPDKRKAHYAVSNAIRDKKLARQPCEKCGEYGEAHHHDYSKPLDVIWLCRRHHMELHRKHA